MPKSVSDFCRRDGATLEELRFDDDMDDEVTNGHILLKEMIEKMKKAGIEVDPAFLFPEHYTLPKNEVKDENERRTED